MPAWLSKFAFLAVASGVWWLLTQTEMAVHSQTTTGPVVGDASLQMISQQLPTGVQQLSILDTRARTLAVYHLEPTNGKIQLKSVRNIVWDLQMEHFNGQAPLPSELRQVQP